MQTQPTGSANLSKLSDVLMKFNLDERLLRYTIREIYDHYPGLDFILTLNDPIGFANMIDIRFIRTEIRNLELIQQTQGSLSVKETLRLEELNSFVEIYEELKSGENRVQRSLYIKIPLITTAKLYVFDLTINILRLIGGYGSLAYSGND